MFNVKCTDTDCNQGQIEFTFFGNEPYVRCGGCAAELTPYNQQDDPPTEPFTLGGNTE
jgi:ribosomal protein S27E